VTGGYSPAQILSNEADCSLYSDIFAEFDDRQKLLERRAPTWAHKGRSNTLK